MTFIRTGISAGFALCAAVVLSGFLGKGCKNETTKAVGAETEQLGKTEVQPEKTEGKTVAENKVVGQLISAEEGLLYVIDKAGTGNKVAENGTKATVHYTGYLAKTDENGELVKDENGNVVADLTKKFDSSRDRDMTFAFKLGENRVIRGWELGVQGMTVGEQRRLIIPSELGYGARGAGSSIPGGATLVFDVELVDVA